MRIVTSLVALTGLALLVLMWIASQPSPRPRSSEGSPVVATPSTEVPPASGGAGFTRPPAGQATKQPVSGALGYFVVTLADGSSYLEGPDGKRQPLTRAVPVIDAPGLEKKVTDKVAGPAKAPADVKPDSLYFLEKGVVAVPPGGIVTFVGKDHVVVLEDAGTVVYYADGRHTEVRERRPKNLP